MVGKPFVICFCYLCGPDRVERSTAFLSCWTYWPIETLHDLFSHNLWTKNKGLCTVRELPTWPIAPLFSTLMFAGFPNQSPLLTMVKDTWVLFCNILILRDRSLFIAWGEGGCWGDHLIFRKIKGGICRNWQPKRGDHWKLWKDSEGGPLKFPRKMKTWGGSRKSSKVIRGDHFSEITVKVRMGYISPSPLPPPPIPGDK